MFAYNATAVPPGLEYLTQIDQILIYQKLEIFGDFVFSEVSNQYEIKNSLGQKIYTAKEVSDCCPGVYCHKRRGLDLEISDSNEREVIHLVKPFRFSSCWCPFCLQEMEVQAPPGNTIGYVVQNWHPFLPKFSILNSSKETVLTVEGPLCALSCGGDMNFDVKGKDKSVIGCIGRQWSDFIKENLTDDNFGISFPMDLDVKMKAVLLGACFVLDVILFEYVRHSRNRNQCPGLCK